MERLLIRDTVSRLEHCDAGVLATEKALEMVLGRLMCLRFFGTKRMNEERTKRYDTIINLMRLKSGFRSPSKIQKAENIGHEIDPRRSRKLTRV